jgi:hypothetical protein
MQQADIKEEEKIINDSDSNYTDTASKQPKEP